MKKNGSRTNLASYCNILVIGDCSFVGFHFLKITFQVASMKKSNEKNFLNCEIHGAYSVIIYGPEVQTPNVRTMLSWSSLRAVTASLLHFFKNKLKKLIKHFEIFFKLKISLDKLLFIHSPPEDQCFQRNITPVKLCQANLNNELTRSLEDSTTGGGEGSFELGKLGMMRERE